MKKRLFKWFAVFLILYGGGFAYYFIESQVRYSLIDGQGIAVFTGGSGRIERALERIKEGSQLPVLITGVDEKVSPDYLLKDLTPDQREQVTIDYMAQTTRDNVVMARSWAQGEGLDSIDLVTAYYHMPRSMMLFAENNGGLTIWPDPVYPEEVPVSFLIREYHKYLLTALRIL